MRKILPLFILTVFISCAGDSADDEIDLDQVYQELTEEVIEPVWSIRSDGQFFEIELPSVMEERENLNPDADLQYGFVGFIDSLQRENFILVLTEEFPEEKMDSVDHVGFTEAYIDSLMGGRDFEVLNEPAIESINQMNAIIHEISSSFSGPDNELIELYYMFGVFKGERALYQVLTWTLMDQKETFRADMKHMMYSFKELN